MNISELKSSLEFHVNLAPVILMTEKKMLNQDIGTDVKPHSKESRLIKQFKKAVGNKSIEPLVASFDDFSVPEDILGTQYFVILSKDNAESLLNIGSKALSNFVFLNRLIPSDSDQLLMPNHLIEDEDKVIDDLDIAIERCDECEKALEELEVEEKEKEEEQKRQKEIEEAKAEEEKRRQEAETVEEEIEDEPVEEQEEEDIAPDESTRVERYDNEPSDVAEESQEEPVEEDALTSNFKLLTQELQDQLQQSLLISPLNQEDVDNVFDVRKIQEEADRAGLDYSGLLTLLNNTKSDLIDQCVRANNELEDRYYQAFDDLYNTLVRQMEKAYEGINIRTDLTYKNVYSDRLDELNRLKEENAEHIEDEMSRQRQVLETQLQEERDTFINQAKERAGIEFDETHRDDVENTIEQLRAMYARHFQDHYDCEIQNIYNDAEKDYQDSVAGLPSKMMQSYQSEIEAKRHELNALRKESQAKFEEAISEHNHEFSSQVTRMVNRQIEERNSFDKRAQQIQTDYEKQLASAKDVETQLSSKLDNERQQSIELKKQLKEEKTRLKNERQESEKAQKQNKLDLDNVQSLLDKAETDKQQQKIEMEQLQSQCEAQKRELGRFRTEDKKGLTYHNLNIFGTAIAGCATALIAIGMLTYSATKNNEIRVANNETQQSAMQNLKNQNKKLNDRLNKFESSAKEEKEAPAHAKKQKAYAVGDDIKLDIDGKGEKTYKIEKVTENGILVKGDHKEDIYVPYQTTRGDD